MSFDQASDRGTTGRSIIEVKHQHGSCMESKVNMGQTSRHYTNTQSKVNLGYTRSMVTWIEHRHKGSTTIRPHFVLALLFFAAEDYFLYISFHTFFVSTSKQYITSIESHRFDLKAAQCSKFNIFIPFQLWF